jgi:alpha-1,2-mannosyltransferase
LLSLRHPGLWDQLLPAAYLSVYLLVLVGSAWAFSREARRPAAAPASAVLSESDYGADVFVR